MENEKRMNSMPAILGAPYDFSRPSQDPDIAFARFAKDGIWGYAQSIFTKEELKSSLAAFDEIVNYPTPDEKRVIEKLALELSHAY